MTLLPLTTEALLAFVRSPAYAALGAVPISPLRAQAQARNPRARPDDPLLFIAVDDDEQLLGYLGTLPGDAAERHLAWLSCIWTSPAARGRGVAKALVRAAYDAYDGYLLLTEFTGPARRLYDRMGLFLPLREQPGIRLYFRAASAELLPPRHRFFARIEPLLRGVDRLANVLFTLRPALRAYRHPPAGWTEETHFTPELTDWIAARQREELFPRNAADLAWIRDYPWVFTGPDPARIAPRYAFTARADRYEAPLLSLRDDRGRLRAVVLLRRTNQALKLIAAYFDPPETRAVADLLFHCCIRHRLAYLTVYDQRLLPALAGRGPALYRRPRLRAYYQSDRLAAVLGSPAGGRIQDGSGDVFGV